MPPITFAFTLTDSSLILFACIIITYLYLKHFHVQQSLVHPLLLRKQSDVSQLSNRPASGINDVADLLLTKSLSSSSPSDGGASVGRKRVVLGQELTNIDLELLARRVLSNLSHEFPCTSSSSHLILLPPSSATTQSQGQTSQIAYLAIHLAKSLASKDSGSGFDLSILDSQRHLVRALEDVKTSSLSQHAMPIVVIPDDSLLEDVLEQLVEEDHERGSGEIQAGVIVLDHITGDCAGDKTSSRDSARQAAARAGVKVVWWEEPIASESGTALGGGGKTSEPQEAVRGSTMDPGVHCIAYVSEPTRQRLVVTNENITAGIAGLLSIFPAHKRPSITSTSTGTRDTIVSSQGINTPFGLSLLLASVYCGAGFASIDADDLLNDTALEPTIAFLRPKQLDHLVTAIERRTRSHPLFNFATRHKTAQLEQGHISRSGWSESLLWSQKRGNVADTLRAVYVIGDTPTQELVTRAQLALSLPVGRIHTSSYCAGPVLATHMYDLQALPILIHGSNNGVGGGGDVATCHSGPPASNVEIVLRGDEVEGMDAGNDPEGELGIRGPSVLQEHSPGVQGNSDANATATDRSTIKTSSIDWTWTGREARALTNGAFVVAPS